MFQLSLFFNFVSMTTRRIGSLRRCISLLPPTIFLEPSGKPFFESFLKIVAEMIKSIYFHVHFFKGVSSNDWLSHYSAH